MIRRIVLVAALACGIALSALAFFLASEVQRTPGFEGLDFRGFIGAVTVLGGTALAVGVTILWRKPGNRIGTLLLTGALLLMSVFTAWPASIVLGANDYPGLDGLATLWGTVAVLPAVVTRPQLRQDRRQHVAVAVHAFGDLQTVAARDEWIGELQEKIVQKPTKDCEHLGLLSPAT